MAYVVGVLAVAERRINVIFVIRHALIILLIYPFVQSIVVVVLVEAILMKVNSIELTVVVSRFYFMLARMTKHRINFLKQVQEVFLGIE